jgi:hypothetical protein
VHVRLKILLLILLMGVSLAVAAELTLYFWGDQYGDPVRVNNTISIKVPTLHAMVLASLSFIGGAIATVAAICIGLFFLNDWWRDRKIRARSKIDWDHIGLEEPQKGCKGPWCTGRQTSVK